ncbi:hypothetical protein PsYK624_170330 [Phanerochaete sordida]|uniref:Uncharacterized protein n=1 Tax=Phanerochaete sordida TaxID=48140 RepID=A0A9P3GSJ4_9APHY|nr:hypothetical protein PsYK624_170330 [Phanerochaete sordida]
MAKGMPTIRRTKTKAEREAAKGGKAGNPGNFKGAEKDLLEALVPEFLAIDRTTSRGKSGRFVEFWYKVSRAFWGNVSLARAREILGKKVEGMDDQLATVVVNDAVINFFRWKQRSAGMTDRNPWRATLQALNRPQNGAPRMIPAWQVYAAEYRDKLMLEYRLLETADNKGIALRNKIARDQFAALDAVDQDRLAAIAKERHAERMREYKKQVEGGEGGVADPEVQAEATARLSRVVTPLLKLVSEQTGLGVISLIAGSAPKESGGVYRCVGVHYGHSVRTNQNFAQYDPDAYRNQVIGSFVNFVASTSEATMNDMKPVNVPEDRAFRVIVVDPYEREREDKAQEMAEEVAKKRRKAKAKGKKAKKTQAAAQGAGSNAQSATTASASAVGALGSSIGSSAAGASTESGIKADDIFDGAPVFTLNPDAASANDDDGHVQLPSTELDIPNPHNYVSHTPLSSLSLLPPMPANPDDPLPQFIDIEAAMMNAPIPYLDFDLDLDDFTATSTGLLTPSSDSLSTPPSPGSSLAYMYDIPPATPSTDTRATSEAPSQADSMPDAPPPLPLENTILDLPPAAPIQPTSADPRDDPAQEPASVDAARDGPAQEPSPGPSASTTLDTVELDDKGTPAWFRDLYAKMREASVGEKHRDEWLSVVNAWGRLEMTYGFNDPGGQLTTKSRPTVIGRWIKDARNKPLDMTLSPKYASEFPTWWDNLNPQWRHRVDGQLVPGGSGDWSCMVVKGINGLLSVVSGLRGYQKAVDEEQWLVLLRDVRWVLVQLQAAASSKKRSNEEASGPSRKRARK